MPPCDVRFRSPVCPVYSPTGTGSAVAAARGHRGGGVGGWGCWPTAGGGVAGPPAALQVRCCYDEPVAAAVQSFTAWRHNLLAISAAAAAAGATSGVHHHQHHHHHHAGRAGLQHPSRPPPTAAPSTVIDGPPLSLRFDHCRLPAALMMSHQDGSDLNSNGPLLDRESLTIFIHHNIIHHNYVHFRTFFCS